MEIAIGEQTLRERAESDAADAFFFQYIEDAGLDFPIEHGIFGLMDEAGSAEAAECVGGGFGLFRIVAGNARIESLAGANGLIERGHGFFNWRFGVGTVGIKNVDVVEVHALEALVETGEKIFAGTPIAIRTGPHVPASLGGDNEFIAMSGKVAVEDAAEIFFGGARRRTVIVGEVEVGDAEVESATKHSLDVAEGVDSAEIVPKAKRNGGE